MKHKFLSFLLLVPLLASCNINNDKNEGVYDFDYYLFSMTNSSNEFEDYFGVGDTETIYFNNQNDLDAFQTKIKDLYLDPIASDSHDEYFSNEVDFNSYSIALTAIYVDHSYSYVNLTSLVKGKNKILQNFVIDIESPSTPTNDYTFLYVILPNEVNLPIDSKIKINKNYNPFVCYKPVIYFYSDVERDLTVKFKDDSRLLTTYPLYNDGWNLHLNSDGTFNVVGNDRSYYALYFDEQSNFYCHFNEGFYVNKNTAITFLEEKLAILGFNEREANEFIMYWLPTLENNEHSLVYFEETDIRNIECPLEFSTNSDSLLRVIIHIKKVSGPCEIKEQKLDDSFVRQGFSVVEWGGVSYGD